MRILVLNATGPALLGSSYARAFRKLGHEVVQYDPVNLLNEDPLYRNRYSRRLLERSLLARNEGKLVRKLLSFDADLIWVGKGQWALPGLWRALKDARPRSVLVNYNSDDPVTTYSRGANAPWVTEAISCFDLFCTFKPDIVSDLRKHGAKEVAVLPFAWDEDALPRAEAAEMRYDVLFLANGDEYRAKILVEILADPRTVDWRFGIFGHWRRSGNARLDALARPMPFAQEQIPAAMAAAVVSLNVLREQNLTNHNLRTFEIPGAGGLSLSQYTAEQDRFFPRNQAALYFDTPTEAVDEVLAIRNDPDRRARMVEAAGKIAQQHRFVDRARALLDAVSELAPVAGGEPPMKKSGAMS